MVRLEVTRERSAGGGKVGYTWINAVPGGEGGCWVVVV